MKEQVENKMRKKTPEAVLCTNKQANVPSLVSLKLLIISRHARLIFEK